MVNPFASSPKPPFPSTFPGVLLTSILLSAGVSCTDLVEFDSSWDSSLVVLSPVDLSITGTFPEVSGARCLMVTAGRVFVASAQGKVFIFDSESRELLRESVVGLPSSAGYGSMVYSPDEGTAYLIGASGKVLELSVPGCQVLDEFSVCSSPSDLEITPGNPGYLWVLDIPSNSIHRVMLANNAPAGQLVFSDETLLRCMESSLAPDTLIVGTSELVYRVEVLGTGVLRKTYVPGILGSVETISTIPNTTFYSAVIDNRLGLLDPYPADTMANGGGAFLLIEHVDGDLHETAAGSDNVHGYLLSYLGSGTSRICSFNYVTPQGIESSVVFDKIPQDMEISGEGNIYVLCY